MVNIAINGFGRIGRLVLRAALQQKGVTVIGINDLGDLKTMAHLFKYDSTHGKFTGSVKTTKSSLIINGKSINFSQIKNPEELPWKKLKVDVVFESTGVFRKESQLQMHLKAGAKKVLLSAPAKEGNITTVVRGVNDTNLKKQTFVSNASCTTNSLAPILKIIEKKFGIEKGFMTTVHSYTGDQRLLDFPHDDLRRARSAATNIIPTSTGAAKAVGLVIPSLKGKMDGIAIRVPTPDASYTDVTVVLKKAATPQAVNNAIKVAAKKEMKNIIEYSEEELVSTDIIGNPHSTIFDAKQTKTNGKLLKFGTWYDNEWGFANRMVEVAKMMG